jgi:phosphoribosyl 1,2-cyclic phosphodiesterase
MKAGHSVVCENDSTKAMTQIRAERPDCVITDLMMPGVTGYQIVTDIKADADLKETSVIVVSAKAFDFDRRQALKMGADGFFQKPIDPKTYAKAIEDILSDTIEMTPWGVRGTLPVAGERALRYGGNTSCVSLRFPRNRTFIFDAGTGIKELSNAVLARDGGKLAAKIFISHPHWDHINALPFFVPLYIAGNEFEILGVSHPHATTRELISAQMDDVYFPITLKEFGARVYFRDIEEGTYTIDGIAVTTMLLSHPGNCLGYRIDYHGRSVCYVTDNELFLPDSPHYNLRYVEDLARFVSGTDALITDCTYLDEDYPSRVGWGHSCVSQVVDLAARAEVKTLYLVHHDPDQNDAAIDAKLASAQEQLAKANPAVSCLAPQEGETFKI